MYKGTDLRRWLACGAAVSVLAVAAPAMAESPTYAFDVAAKPMTEAVQEVGRQAGVNILVDPRLVAGRRAPALRGEMTTEVALNQLLEGTGLEVQQTAANSLLIRRASGPQGGSAGNAVEALIVTAQKREEDIQDVPIAISAFSQEDLTRSQVAGGPDLMTQVPNMTFTKTNFTSYSIQIRGIGTQAISATTDAAVAVAFNNTPFIRNRFFEQEFYDLQRVEVLRGPQGTLYGRNATAGVVNLISAKPTFGYEAKVSADVANYNSTRLEGMVNVPLVEDAVALRLAGAWTKREGYSTNSLTGNPIDGRNLWSTRLSLRFAPTDSIDANLIWEHFKEDDDRLRSGKQTCKTHFVTDVMGIPTGLATNMPGAGSSQIWAGVQGMLSQGCIANSLYAPDSFETPNGKSLPYYLPLGNIGLPIPGFQDYNLDPYASRVQSSDLRVIESVVDPKYRAESDLAELQVNIDIAENLTLTSETAYSVDHLFSSQDFNRFNTARGAFANPGDATALGYRRDGLLEEGPDGGIFCDPQIGCADRLVGMDLSTATSTQYSQEFRIGSDYDGPFNFSTGVNFLRHDTVDKYYVFFNTLTMTAAHSVFNPSIGSSNQFSYLGQMPAWEAGVSDNHECLRYGFGEPDPLAASDVRGCVYIDPNPIESLNDLGHNYFLSKNPYKLISYALFGEVYYNLTENLKITAGARWTVDKKEAPIIPSWVLAVDTVGYPVAEVVRQQWETPTGRLTIDWKPDLGFTDETLLYASLAHGYKSGGVNPPRAGIVCYLCKPSDDVFARASATHPKTFEPEYVDALELGMKNTLLGGGLTLNLAGFYYDYRGYQISQIVDRSAINQNFDATVWGLEIEADWRPIENLRLGFKGGYEHTRVADGEQAVDIMDRTAGKPGWVVVNPIPTGTSNCIMPEWLFTATKPEFGPVGPPFPASMGRMAEGGPGPCELAYFKGFDPVTDAPYVDLTTHVGPIVQGGDSTLSFRPGYPGWNPATAPNNGEGFYKDLSGNQLPNAPHFTATVTADYTLPLPNDWLATLHTDLYYQSEAWTRIFNMEGYDKLKAYTNVNVAAIFTNEEAGWKVMAYVKNVFDRDSITGSFLNSDDTGLTTNVFLTEPRLYGVRVTKEFEGGPWWTGAGSDHHGPFPLTVEISGQVQRQAAANEDFQASSLAGLPSQLDLSGIQNRDLDWGDGRSVKLTYRPDGSLWSASAAVRYGRTNSGTTRAHHEFREAEGVCGFSSTAYGGAVARTFCDPEYLKYGQSYYNPGSVAKPFNWSSGESHRREDHLVVDFAVGRDVGMGSWLDRSTVTAGLRYGDFGSSSSFSALALANWEIADGWSKYNAEPSTHSSYDVDLKAEREFKGTGPMLSWDAAARLMGNDDTGHVTLDWSLAAGALFGKQKTRFDGQEMIQDYAGRWEEFPTTAVGDPEVTGPPADRSASVTVPFVDLSLGLSYQIQRIKVGAGYRWERYSDVLDAGYAVQKDYDRTMDGPYFKLSVGFGG